MASGQAPQVTGISPKEGPPGTKVTIRGEKLGKSQADVIGLEICGVDCLLTCEWASPNKLMARTLLCKIKGDIIVATRSGGIGTSTVQFRGFLEPSCGPTKESAVWVEETINVGPRPLSMSAYQQEDPLQISVEGNEKKFPVEELLELFPEGSGNLRADNFSAAWFLLENHHGTSFEDLKSGHHFLGRKVNSQTEGKLSFLKENINSVMGQLDALIDLKEKCDKYRTKNPNSYVSQIDDSIGVCEREAWKMFQGVLSKKDRADMTRNALSGYQKFKFLFSLPGTMEKSIQKEEFDLAINDYGRARALFQQPELDKPIFRKFQTEVESRVEKLRETLKQKLLEKPPNVEEQRTILEYLKTLESSGDFAWDCLICHYEFMSSSMKGCFQQFASAEHSKDILLKTPSKQDPQLKSDPSEVIFVENICDIFSTCFPDFWHLGQDYFKGKLPVKPNLGRQTDMKKMLVTIAHLFTTLISSCLIPSKKSEFVWNNRGTESLNDGIKACVPIIKETYTEFLELDTPQEMSDLLKNLLFEIRRYSLEIMIHQLSVDVEELYKQENWASEPLGEHGFITALPSKYEDLVIKSTKVIKETLLQKFPDEIQLLKNEEVKKSLQNDMGKALSSFADTLEMLMSQNRTPSKLQSLQAGFLKSIATSAQPSLSTSLLLILNNCSYTKDVILPQIYRSLIKLGFPDMSDAVDSAKRAINGVENLTFSKYTEMKYEPVVGQIEQAMYVGRFDWGKCGEPTGVRPYITRSLLGLLEVIAEVTAVSDKLASTAMGRVVENVCEEFFRLFSCVAKFNENGALQATLDIAAFQDAVSPFLNQTSKAHLNDTFAAIPRAKDLLKGSRRIQSLLEDHRKKAKMQLQCFDLPKRN